MSFNMIPLNEREKILVEGLKFQCRRGLLRDTLAIYVNFKRNKLKCKNLVKLLFCPTYHSSTVGVVTTRKFTFDSDKVFTLVDNNPHFNMICKVQEGLNFKWTKILEMRKSIKEDELWVFLFLGTWSISQVSD